MTRERLKRMQRLVDLGEHAVKVRKQALAVSERSKDDALFALKSSENAWEEEAKSAADIQLTSIEGFADSRTTLDLLRHQVARAVVATKTAASAVDRDRVALSEANVDLKKLELWQGNAQGTLREMEERTERTQTDETAARLRGKKS